MPLLTQAERDLWRAGERWDHRLARSREAGPGGRPVDAGEWLARWRQAIDADDVGLFDRRLSQAGLSMDQAAMMLAGTPGPTEPPDWWGTLTALREACREASSSPEESADAWLAAIEDRLPEPARALPFAHVIAPIADWAWAQVAKELPAISRALAPNARDRLRTHAAQRVGPLMSRALGELFARNRTVGRSLTLALGLDQSHERHAYAAFCLEQCADGLTGLVNEFPVLGRLVARTTETWIAATCELLRRLDDDAELIARTFGCSLPLHILDVSPGAGDTHRGGRCVAIVRLRGPERAVAIVVKPKDVRIEAAYARLAQWFTPDTGQPTVLERNGYGYTSFVSHEACPPSELDAFYRQAGRLLALLYFIGATDGHAENLIAHGRGLALIDPETLFEGRVAATATVEAQPALAESVLRTGLLPSWTREGPLAPAIDISALGVQSVNRPAQRLPGWQHVNTDAMAWGWVDVTAGIALTSLPVPVGDPNPLPQHVDALVDGFAGGYRFATRHREALVRSIQGFRGARRRIVLRPTRVYAVLQARARSPRCLTSANARGIELDRLTRSSLVGQSAPWQAMVSASEISDMECEDIPYFDYPLGSRDIDGTTQTIPEALADDGLEQAVERVLQADERDLAWQVQLIRASVGAGQARIGSVGVAVDPVHAPADQSGSGADSHEAALHDILIRIADAAIEDRRGGLTWLTLGPAGDSTRVTLGLIDSGAYSGRAGLIAFLDAMARYSSDAADRMQAAELLERTWGPLAADLDDPDAYAAFRLLRDAGLGLNGAGGLLSILAPGLAGIDPARTKTACDRIVDAIGNGLVHHDRVRDIVGGAAGAIAPLIAMRNLGPDPRIDDALTALAESIATAQGVHGGWDSPYATRPLTGLAHGASGMALPLLLAGTVLDRTDLVDAGARGFAYEHQALDGDERNWPDYRTDSGTGAFMVAWCHGAPGIGLARIRALEALPGHPDAEEWRNDLRIAAQTSARAVDCGVDHLCCGNLGRAYVVRQAGIHLDDAGLLGRAGEIQQSALSHWARTGSFRLNDLGTGSTAAYAGCMTGLAGIGLSLIAPDSTMRALLG